MTTPINNACDVLLDQNPGTLPDLHGPILDYFQDLSFTEIVKEIVNFNLVETTVTTNFRGVRQPLTPQQLKMKPEGQRKWKWEMIHALPNLVLDIDDQIWFQGEPFRVSSKMDYAQYGFVTYDICQDYNQ